MSVPHEVFSQLRQRLWEQADRLHWTNLPPTAKAKWYEIWTRDPEVGGVLARYLDVAAVRVYIKDTLVKSYTRERSASWDLPRNALALPSDIVTVERFEKPHGRLLEDGRLVTWGAARDWKHVILATHVRVFGHPDRKPYAVVLTDASAKYSIPSDRLIIEDACKKLEIGHVIWLE